MFRNPSSDWAHPVNIVPKAGSAKYRLTVDLRQANALQRPSAYPMSHLESQLSRLHGSTCYQTYDLVQGYWQLPLSEESQACQTFVSPVRTFSPTRVLHGNSNAVAYL